MSKRDQGAAGLCRIIVSTCAVAGLGLLGTWLITGELSWDANAVKILVAIPAGLIAIGLWYALQPGDGGRKNAVLTSPAQQLLRETLENHGDQLPAGLSGQLQQLLPLLGPFGDERKALEQLDVLVRTHLHTAWKQHTGGSENSLSEADELIAWAREQGLLSDAYWPYAELRAPLNAYRRRKQTAATAERVKASFAAGLAVLILEN